jgi:hypothetical protein
MIDYWLYHITSISVSKQDMSGTFHVDMQTAPWKYRFYWIIIWREKPGILIFLPLRDLVLLAKDCKKKSGGVGRVCAPAWIQETSLASWARRRGGFGVSTRFGDLTVIILWSYMILPLPHSPTLFGVSCRDIFFPQESGRLDIWGKSCRVFRWMLGNMIEIRLFSGHGPQVAHDFPNCIWVYLKMLGNPDSIQWWIIFPRFPIKISCIVCYSGSLCSGVGHFPV